MSSKHAATRHPHTRRTLILAGVTLLAVITTIILWTTGTLPAHHQHPTAANNSPDAAIVPITTDRNHDGHPDTLIDTNHDGKLDTGDQPITNLGTDLGDLRNKIGPNPTTTNNTESLITPPGAGWWTFATSIAGELQFDTISPPLNAQWYAVTTQNRVGSSNLTTGNDDPTTYHALYIKFPTTTAATTWMNATMPHAAGAFPEQRGSLLTWAPAYANPNGEPFKRTTNPTRMHLNVSYTPHAAAWVTNLAANDTQMVTNALPAYKTALTTFYNNLGFNSPNIWWSAVATQPAGPWTGTITGYHPHQFNATKAAAAIGSTAKNNCDPGGCITVDPGLLPIVYDMAWKSSTSTTILGRNSNMLPTQAPKNATLTWGYADGMMRGMSEGSELNYSGPVSYQQGWIVGNTMTILTKQQNVPNPPITVKN